MFDYWSRDMLHFDLLEKGLRVTPPYYDWFFMKNVSHAILTEQI